MSLKARIPTNRVAVEILKYSSQIKPSSLHSTVTVSYHFLGRLSAMSSFFFFFFSTCGKCLLSYIGLKKNGRARIESRKESNNA